MERVFEILKDGQWVPVEFKDMKKGDRFRAFDRDDSMKPMADALGSSSYGKIVTDGQGKSEWVAASDAYVHTKGTLKHWRIDRED